MATEFTTLLDKYITHSITAEEHKQLFEWIVSGRHNEELTGILDEQFANKIYAAADDEQLRIKLFELIRHKEVAPEIAVHRIPFLRTAFFKYAAAIIILIASASAYYWISTPKKNRGQADVSAVALAKADVLPGSDKAILTLSNGQKITLDTNARDIISDGKLNIRNKNGMLTYNKTAIDVFNTMSTPKGGQYQLTLVDGTKVWLNAASSITYPTAFTGDKRTVRISGEVYFEVAKNARLPFIVETRLQKVTVLGTHFNINSYEDEGTVNTTLLEGSVKVAVNGVAVDQKTPQAQNIVILKPGEQAQVALAMSSDRRVNRQQLKVINNADINQVMAWKNGAFNFDGLGLEEAMKQLERWYDLEIVYEKGIPNIHLGGKISRNLTLSGLLKGLEEMDVHYRIEKNRKVIILP